MLVNICSAPSSGSTFFADLLNRHPDVACGEELTFLSKPGMYRRFSHFHRWRKLIRRAGYTARPHFERRTVFSHLADYQLDNKTVWRWVKESRSMRELVERFKHHVKELTGKPIWAEKTPLNVAALPEYLDEFGESRVIHLVRAPRDMMLSLMKRGRSLAMAAERWLFSLALVQRVRDDSRLLELRYEDLVTRPEEELKRVCEHLGVKFNIDWFTSDEYKSRGFGERGKHASWNLDPSGGFSSSSIGKWRNCDVDFSPVANMKLLHSCAESLGTPEYTLKAMAEHYGYDLSGLHNDRQERQPFNSRQRFKWRVRLASLFTETDKYPLKVEY